MSDRIDHYIKREYAAALDAYELNSESSATEIIAVLNERCLTDPAIPIERTIPHYLENWHLIQKLITSGILLFALDLRPEDHILVPANWGY